jgi:hypothetical protein
MTKPLTASVAWMPISIPAGRLLSSRAAIKLTPSKAVRAISAVAIMPKELIASQRENETSEAADAENPVQRRE